MDAEKAETSENVKSQIGFCGIWCGSCMVGNGTLRELTKRYEEMTNAYGLGKWCPKDFDYGEFSKGLASIQRMPLCIGCLKGGGRDDCEIRACASNKGLPHAPNVTSAPSASMVKSWRRCARELWRQEYSSKPTELTDRHFFRNGQLC